MKKIKLLLLATIAIFTFNSCEDAVEALGTNYIAFEKAAYSTGVDVGGSATVEVKVFTANITGSDRTFDVTVDGTGAAAGSYTAPASITVPGGSNEGTMSITLTDTNLGIGINSLVISFTEGVAGLSTGSATTVNYMQNCTEISATLDIVFDGYGSETSWEITDALGGVVASKAAGSYADGQASASETITLCAGRDYTFTIGDSYGDGLSWPANGTYTLTINGVVKASGGGDFGTGESTAFDTK